MAQTATAAIASGDGTSRTNRRTENESWLHRRRNRSVKTANPPARSTSRPLKARQQGAWSSGDYAVVGTTLQIVGEELCEALDLRAGQKVLDVAAGNGNVSLAAARRWCDVVATDYVPALLERARERAAAERLDIEFREADAEALPFPDGSFDVVVSTFGVMFTPDQDRAAAEMVRVCRRGGKIGLANWTPEGFIGQLFKTIGKHLPPPAGARSPALWGTRARLAELFEPHATSVEVGAAQLRVPLSLAGALAGGVQDLLRPDAEGVRRARSRRRKRRSQRDLMALIARFNRSGDGTMVVPERVSRDRDHAALTTSCTLLMQLEGLSHEICIALHLVIRPIALSLGIAALSASAYGRPVQAAEHHHTVVSGEAVEWGPAPPSLPPGAKPPSCWAAPPRRGRSCCASSFPPASSSRPIVIRRTSSSP